MRVPRPAIIPLLLLLSACADYPRDTEGTLDRVTKDRLIRVGVMANSLNGEQRGLTRAYLSRVARATHAQPRTVVGGAEPLLSYLEEGQLDLVVGELAADTPWMPDVAIVEPLAERVAGHRNIGLHPIARNGENQWIALLEREARDMRESQ